MQPINKKILSQFMDLSFPQMILLTNLHENKLKRPSLISVAVTGKINVRNWMPEHANLENEYWLYVKTLEIAQHSRINMKESIFSGYNLLLC